MTIYREVSTETLQQRICELEKENLCLKNSPCLPKKYPKKSVFKPLDSKPSLVSRLNDTTSPTSFSAKVATAVTVVFLGAAVTVYFIGFIKFLALLWSIFISFFG